MRENRWTAASLEAHLRAALDRAADGARYELAVVRTSEAFLTRSEALVGGLSAAIREVAGLVPELSTSGGTSDARFFAPICPVVEFGLVNATIHQVDERVPVADLEMLAAIYRRFLDRFFGGGP